MKGYVDQKMSVRALRAYMYGEMPKSKWTKAAMIEAITEIAEDNNVILPDINKLTKDEIFKTFLYDSSMHHTSAAFNYTIFFAVSKTSVLLFDENDLTDLVESRKEKGTKAKKDVSFFRKAQEIYLQIETIYLSNIFCLKTIAGVARKVLKDSLDVSDAYNAALNAIADKDLEKVQAWERLPEEHHRRTLAKLYRENIEEYVREYYNLERKSNKLVKEIQKKLEEEYHDV